MYKVILIPKSLFNDYIDKTDPSLFLNGKVIQQDNRGVDGFWIECKLPAIPRKDDLIEIRRISLEKLYRQLKEVYDQSKGFRQIIYQFRKDHAEYLDGIPNEIVLRRFCGEYRQVDNICSGHWYAERSIFVPNDEYVYVEIRHEL